MSDLTNGSGEQNELTLSIDMAGRLFAGWNDARGGDDYRCGYSYSLDNGLTWATNRRHINPIYVAAGDPVAFSDAAGRTYFICMSFNRSPSTGSTIEVLTSPDGGQTWSNIADIGMPTGMDDKPWGTAYGDGILHVAWSHFLGGGANVVMKTSLDAGNTWGPPVYLTNSGGGALVGLDTDRYGRLYAVYVEGGEVRLRRSDDHGTTFTPPTTVSPAGGDCWSCSPRSTTIPQVSSDPTGQNLYVIWSRDVGDPTWEDIQLAYSHDAGQTWASRVVNDDGTVERQFMPSVDVDHDGIVHMMWSDLRFEGNHSAYYANSTDGGVTISPNVRVSDVPGTPTVGFMGDYNTIVVDDWGTAHIVWCDTRNLADGDAYYSRADLATLGPHWVEIVPQDATIYLNQTLQYTATVKDPYGTAPPDPVEWRVTSGAISPTGLYTPSAVGTWTVRAYAGFRFNETTVTVLPAPLERIVVTPSTATVPAGNTQQFTATGYDALGLPMPISPTWETDGGGTIDGTGLYIGASVGTWTVYANQSGVSGTARVTVTLGPLASLDVAPPFAAITTDQTQQFTATGTDVYGNTGPVTPVWEVTNGSIDAAGLFTPWSVGTWTVYGNLSGLSDTATVDVSAGALVRIGVTPPYAAITVDDTQPFVATGYDAKDNVVPISPTWEATNGTVDGAGLFTPWSLGTWTVYANASGLSGSAVVDVFEGALARIVVAPDGVTITVDDTQQYTATGYDAKGNVVAVNPVWSVTGGSISLTGLYTPTPTGTFLVNASDQGITGSATVHVIAGALARIDVNPKDVTITADDTQQYTATGYDAKDNVVSISPSWSVNGGAISGTGLYTPDATGTFTVTASEGSVSGSTGVTVTAGALVRIDVTPPTATITADDTQQYTATGYDAKDNVVAITPTWAAQGGTISQAGLYDAVRVGAWSVYANQSGISGSASVVVTAGNPFRVEVSPNASALLVGDSQTFTATVYDADDNILAVTVQWSVVGVGSVTQGGVYTSNATGTAQVVASVPGTGAQDHADVTVSARQGGGGEPTAWDYWWIPVIVVVAVVGLLLFLLWRRRKKEEDEAAEPEKPEAEESSP